MSTWMMRSLLVFYAGIAIASLCERNYPRALYWVCAAGITISVLMGMK